MLKTPRDTFDNVKLLAYIASQGHYPALKFVDKSLGPFTREDYNIALLNAAISKGDLEVFEYLTAKGADELATPLIHVSRRGKLNLVMFLVERLKNERTIHRDFNIRTYKVPNNSPQANEQSKPQNKITETRSTLSEDELFPDNPVETCTKSNTKTELFDHVDVFTEVKDNNLNRIRRSGSDGDSPLITNIEADVNLLEQNGVRCFSITEGRYTSIVERSGDRSFEPIDGANEAIISAAAMGRQDVVAYLSRYVEPNIIRKVQGMLRRHSKAELHRSAEDVTQARIMKISNDSMSSKNVTPAAKRYTSEIKRYSIITRGRSSSVV